MKTKIMKTKNLIIIILSALFFVNCNKEVDNNPVVKWTAQLPESTKTNLGYNLLENTQTTTLYDAKPETGTYSHHPHITYFKGIIFIFHISTLA